MTLRAISNFSRLARAGVFSRSISTLSRQSNSKPAISLPHKFQFTPVTTMARNFSSKPDLATYEDVKNLPKKPDTLLIDVREPQELIDTGVVPTSINIPLGQVVAKLSPDFSPEDFQKLYNRKKPAADTEIIFMCKIGGRSQKALDMSRALGYKNMKNYLGSWEEWKVKEGLAK